ncbi:MAG: hypothetical protein KatS3mg093_221 [Candidatus Parcubacteria bacterium]|nr:MAG: hypothetical protein KatS3mg093_221 [Candidatus Parcubacteria bacterium]
MNKDLKNLKIQTVKYAPPPPGLPIYGQVNPRKITFIGKTNYSTGLEQKKFIFGIKRLDRKNNVNIIGRSGVGKSKMLEIMIRQDIFYDYGLCLFDFDGDIISSLLDFIPKEKINNVILIDFAVKDKFIAFNPFSNIHSDFKHQFVNGLIEIMKNQFGENWNWTPRLEHLFRFTILALLEKPNSTFKDIILMLTDINFRKNVIHFIHDDLTKNFWENEFGHLSNFKNFNDEVLIPLINKISTLLSNPYLNSVLSQTENKINFNDFIENNKIVLINLSNQIIGKNEASFLGLLMLLNIKQAGFLRMSLNQNFNEYYIYVDDFYMINNKVFEEFIINSKKYKFLLTLAYKQISQFDSNLRNTILNNFSNHIIFRLTNEDATILKSEFNPFFDIKDMINLGNQEFYIKMIIDGETKDPFSAQTLKVLKPHHPSFKNEILKKSFLDYYLNKPE